MFPVDLWVYDLSGGLAKLKSREILGIHIEGIWHTSVVVFGWEYYFSSGIRRSPPGTTHFGKPIEVIRCGETAGDQSELEDFLREINEYFTRETYNILENNCNHFSNAVCMQLLGKEIPGYILDLPLTVKNSPLGVMLAALASEPRSITGESFLNIPPDTATSNTAALHNPVSPNTAAAATESNAASETSPGDCTGRVSSPDSG